ncbi:MAG TPA: hypothetical protein VF884_08805 [Nitrososphaeraceae archaeon]
MNVFEVAILRILVKRRNAIRISSLIDGFPDNSRADVLLAISKLNNLGFIILYNHYPEEEVLIRKDRRREVFTIIDPSAHFVRKHVEDVQTHHPTVKSAPVLRPIATMLSILLVSFIGITTLLNNAIPAGNVDQNYVGLHVRPQFFNSYFHTHTNGLFDNHLIGSDSSESSSNQYYLKMNFPFSPLRHMSYACHHPDSLLGNRIA